MGGGVSGGVGEVEVGLETKGIENGVEGAEEAGAAEPFAENGGGWPKGGWWAAGVGAEGAKKNCLGAGGVGDVRHKGLLGKGLWLFVCWMGLKKAPPKRPQSAARISPESLLSFPMATPI